MVKTRPTRGGKAKPVGSAMMATAASAMTSPPSPPAITHLTANFGAANLAAAFRASAALIEGFEAIGKSVHDYARASFGGATRAAISMIEARDLVDVVAVNRNFAQIALEGLLATSARIAEIGIRVASEALKPLDDRGTDAVSTIHRPTKTAAL